jgi:endonuclease YncB( thermonuclease family)
VTLLWAPAASAVDTQTAVVREVLTGDTVRLAGGKTLRYASLQAPALQSKIPLVRTYGENSLAFNKSLVEGKTVRIHWGARLYDERKNLLGYVYLEDGTFVNEVVLKAGHAKLALAPPNLAHDGEFRRAEMDARRDKRGLWKEEPDNPFLKSEYIGDTNTKLYHNPTCPLLERIPAAHTQSFKTRVDAKAKGYRRCKDCADSGQVEDE